MKKGHFFTLFTLIGLLLSCRQSKIDFKPTFVESKKTTHNISDDQEYTFGYLTVLENRKNPKSDSIKIPIYIFKSRSTNPKPDPIIYTVGGPGSSTMPSAKYMKYYKYLDDRDLILFEQRGNAYADPHLDCPEWSEAVYQSNLPSFQSIVNENLMTKAAKACKERLTQGGIDLNGYNTNEIAADISDLKEALDLEDYNLLTISYSTKIAQVLLRDYPEEIRSVVMDSPLPLEVSYDEESTNNLLNALENLLSDCEADEKCNLAYPNLKQRFFKYLREKTENPLEVDVINPTTKKSETFFLKGKDLVEVFSSASTGDVANIPLEINKILNNDLSSVKKQLAFLFSGPGSGSGIGMRLSVWCAEEYPFNSQETILDETNKYPEIKGLSPATFDSEICKIWGVEKVQSIENQPIKSNIPILLINGEYDEVTPVKWANNMKTNFEKSTHVIFKGWKHTPTTNWGNQCAMQVANDFFNASNNPIISECIKENSAPSFLVE